MYEEKEIDSLQRNHEKKTSWFSLILSGIIRMIGGLAGLFILWGLYDYIFVQGKIPIWSGYYGPVMFPIMLYFSFMLIGYAIGGQNFLRRFFPKWAENHGDASNPDLKEKHIDDDASKK